MKIRFAFVFMLAGLLTVGVAVAAQPVSDVQRLNQALDQLAASPTLGQYAQAERQLARQSVQNLAQASGKRHAFALYMAEHRVDIAKAAAKLDQARGTLAGLQAQRSKILLQASQRDAAATQRALEQAQLRNQLAAEQTQRLQAQGQAYSQAAQKAQAEAAQANKLAQSQAHAAALAKKQAALAASAVQLLQKQLESLKPHQGAQGLQMTVGGEAFASGSATLRPEAKTHLGKLVDFAKSAPDKHIRVEGYTDSTGNAATNQSLSLQRAQAVAQVLIAHGISRTRVTSVGMGESDPVASNSTAAGRAKNRRVVVVLQSH